jgi:hypothetical protein
MFYATGLPGWARWSHPSSFGPYQGMVMTEAEQLEALREEARFMEEELNAMRKRISELEKHAREEQK